MSKTRIGLLVFLFLAPWLFLIGVGGYHLWTLGYSWVWWIAIVLSGVAYFLAWRWTRSGGFFPPTDTPPPNYWTDRDKTAWEKVTAKAKHYERITTDQLADPHHYSELAIDLAGQIGAVYSPAGAGPFDHLTIPEVLACIELAAADLNDLVRKYVPGSHLLRVRDYKAAKKAADWYQVGQNVYWAGAALFNPAAILRWAATRYGLGTMFDKLQGNILLWFHTAFVHQLGRYLIEMNSGRLKVGVKRYRELLTAHQEPPVEATPAPEELASREPARPEPAPGPKPIGIAVLGPVKAGKSSLVNTLLRKQDATVDTLPVAHIGTRYNLTLPGGQPITLLDTAGYGQEGANEEEFGLAVEASRDADLVLFVTTATNPGRRADVDLLDRLRAWFAGHPELKLPPVVAAVNQIDLLSPKAEWSPPYNWQTGTRPKEVNIRECVAAVKEQLGNRVADVVPVCGRQGETFGFTEGLVPAIA
jgi:hypothetical protein